MSFTIDEERRPLKAAEETKIMVSRQILTDIDLHWQTDKLIFLTINNTILGIHSDQFRLKVELQAIGLKSIRLRMPKARQ